MLEEVTNVSLDIKHENFLPLLESEASSVTMILDRPSPSNNVDSTEEPSHQVKQVKFTTDGAAVLQEHFKLS